MKQQVEGHLTYVINFDVANYFQCSFIPKFSISIQTRYEDNNGTTENVSCIPKNDVFLYEIELVGSR